MAVNKKKALKMKRDSEKAKQTVQARLFNESKTFASKYATKEQILGFIEMFNDIQDDEHIDVE